MNQQLKNGEIWYIKSESLKLSVVRVENLADKTVCLYVNNNFHIYPTQGWRYDGVYLISDIVWVEKVDVPTTQKG